jgi:hypothetical protein
MPLLLWFTVAAASQGRGPSTPEERKRVVELVSKLQKDPLNPALVKEREWALKWLIEVPDITVSVCSDVLSPVLKTKYRYSSDLFVLHTLSAAAFVIQNPDQAKDQVQVNLAATKAMLDGYEAIVTKDPSRKSKELDELKAVMDSGGLVNFVRVGLAKCSSGPKS